ncbi:MAG: hypothetical protein NT061_01400 [Spirochaetes bacterium]|nr:hypothetical protein [Spirochaetota bacterium]
MDVRRKATPRRISIVYALPEASSRLDRFDAMLRSAGVNASLACVANIGDLAAFVAQYMPDLVFCAPDHLPDTGSNPASFVNVHAWLESRGVPFAGSPAIVLDLALSKPSLKRRWMLDGIRTPAFYSCSTQSDPELLDGSLIPPFPCIVKPADGGNSRGINPDSVVRDMEGLRLAIGRLAPDFRQVLIEEYLGDCPDFREITCACVGNGKGMLCLPVEIRLNSSGSTKVITTGDKDEGRAVALPIDDSGLRKEAEALAFRIFSSLGVQDYSRCDIIHANRKLWGIEVNGQPMIPDPWFGSCMAEAGLSEEQYLAAVIVTAWRRAGREGGFDAFLPEGLSSLIPEWLDRRL